MSVQPGSSLATCSRLACLFESYVTSVASHSCLVRQRHTAVSYADSANWGHSQTLESYRPDSRNIQSAPMPASRGMPPNVLPQKGAVFGVFIVHTVCMCCWGALAVRLCFLWPCPESCAMGLTGPMGFNTLEASRVLSERKCFAAADPNRDFLVADMHACLSLVGTTARPKLGRRVACC